MEYSPAHFSPEQTKRNLAMLEILPKFDRGKTTPIDELPAIKPRLMSVEEMFEVFASTTKTVEGDLASFRLLKLTFGNCETRQAF